ncbi:oligosaccharide flippase family protein, partial [Pseudoalteromonas sp. KS88]|uniref:oligosaccharide flippase family protein n=1 Tax=Pseudoalteromonas sp. KS88 TaxID=2109918 RepID=UPI00108093CE
MKSIKNLLIYGAGESLGKGLNILLMVILPFLLPVNEYGKLAVVVITEQILMFLLLRGQNNSILRFWNKGNKQREYLYSTISNTLIKRNSYIYSIAFIFVFAYAIIDGDGYPYLIILMSIPFLVLTELKLAVFRVEGKSKKYVVYRITFQTLKFILVITFINFYFNSVLGYCIGVLGAVLIVNYCFKIKLYKSSFYTKKSAITDVVLNYGTPLGLQVAINLFYSAADRYMLLYLSDTETVSIYSFSYTLATTLLFFANIAIVGLIPVFYKIEPANSAFKYLIKIFLSIGVFITLLGILINLYIYPVMISLYD